MSEFIRVPEELPVKALLTEQELDLQRWRALGRGGRLPVPADAYAYRFLTRPTPFDLLSNSEGNR